MFSWVGPIIKSTSTTTTVRVIAYFAGQQTDRLHYTGIIPDDEAGRLAHVNKPPYGTTANTTLQGGVQFNHRFQEFLGGKMY
jgi:outer membrane receptor for ferrienterochelin and colicins